MKYNNSTKRLQPSTILTITIFFLLTAHFLIHTAPVSSETNDGNKYSNRLKNEKSPYLLQHADNPVDWYAWGEEAFKRAEKENKPIFLSIGYSTCHWCHVMEHESFEDPEVAKLMNDAFVSIKVDREERPDIDNVYMQVCRMLSKGSCGWPLTIFMTPDKKPFFAATYIPKYQRFGRTGMMQLIPNVKKAWTENHNDLLNSANQVTAALNKSNQTSVSQSVNLDTNTLKLAFKQLENRFDTVNGGFGTARKFPSPHNYLFLLRYWKRSGDNKPLDMVEKTLINMRQGGIYDQIGFGFHRYSIVPDWLVPHFEKMLYDQAMIAMAYIEAYQATGKRIYRQTAEEIFTYVLRDMTDSKGGFYSAEDADSEGKEGKFYLWTKEEITKILGNENNKLFINIYNVKEGGNFRGDAEEGHENKNILHLNKFLSESASTFNLSENELEISIERSRQELFEEREERVHPYKDDKVLTDWNGLMIAAMAKGARAFDEPRYEKASKHAADFILNNMITKDGRLLHRYRDGKAGIKAHVDDYAFLIWGLIELYETNFDVLYLQTAIDLNETLIKHYWDDVNGGFYFTADDGEELLIRQKEIYDGAIPSGNSVAMLNLLRLGRITANAQYEEKASLIQSIFSDRLKRGPSGFAQVMSALDFGIGPSHEIVIVGDPNAKDTESMLKALRKQFIPNKVVLLKPIGEASAITSIAEFTKGQSALNGKATAYVCKNYICHFPTNDIDKMLELLRLNTVENAKTL